MLIKTDKGRQELSPGRRSLGQRERALLLLADGRQDSRQLAAMFGGEGRQLIRTLLQQGYLQEQGAQAAPASKANGNATAPAAGPGAAHGEQFTGTRSLATARMFLFDLSERLFAPRDKALAEHYRQALREAREPQAMLAAGRAMIADIEAIAGSERADGISERLAKLLPTELLAPAD